MKTVRSYFNPFSKEHHAFSTLFDSAMPWRNKWGIFTISFIVGCLTLGFGGIAFFRAWVDKTCGTGETSRVEKQRHVSPLQHKSPNTSTPIKHDTIDDFIKSLDALNYIEVSDPIGTMGWSRSIRFNGKEQTKSQCHWQITIAPAREPGGSAKILNTLLPVLKRLEATCYIVASEERLQAKSSERPHRMKDVYKGVMLTIRPKSDDEALEIAKEIAIALSHSNIPQSLTPVRPCQHRPLGSSDFLWATNTLSGYATSRMVYDNKLAFEPRNRLIGRICEEAGNYQVSYVPPEHLKQFKGMLEKKDREEIIHEDIFEATFGPVKWHGQPESDSGYFENLSPKKGTSYKMGQ